MTNKTQGWDDEEETIINFTPKPRTVAPSADAAPADSRDARDSVSIPEPSDHSDIFPRYGAPPEPPMPSTPPPSNIYGLQPRESESGFAPGLTSVGRRRSTSGQDPYLAGAALEDAATVTDASGPPPLPPIPPLPEIDPNARAGENGAAGQNAAIDTPSWAEPRRIDSVRPFAPTKDADDMPGAATDVPAPDLKADEVAIPETRNEHNGLSQAPEEGVYDPNEASLPGFNPFSRSVSPRAVSRAEESKFDAEARIFGLQPPSVHEEVPAEQANGAGIADTAEHVAAAPGLTPPIDSRELPPAAEIVQVEESRAVEAEELPRSAKVDSIWDSSWLDAVAPPPAHAPSSAPESADMGHAPEAIDSGSSQPKVAAEVLQHADLAPALSESPAEISGPAGWELKEDSPTAGEIDPVVESIPRANEVPPPMLVATAAAEPEEDLYADNFQPSASVPAAAVEIDTPAPEQAASVDSPVVSTAAPEWLEFGAASSGVTPLSTESVPPPPEPTPDRAYTIDPPTVMDVPIAARQILDAMHPADARPLRERPASPPEALPPSEARQASEPAFRLPAGSEGPRAGLDSGIKLPDPDPDRLGTRTPPRAFGANDTIAPAAPFGGASPSIDLEAGAIGSRGRLERDADELPTDPDLESEMEKTNLRIAVRPVAEVADVAWLAVLKSPSSHARQIYLLDELRMEMGRALDAPIFIDDKTVSSRHAAIRYEKVEEQFEFVFYDLASTNGSYVNDEHTHMSVLQDDDRIRLGETELVFKKVGEPRSAM